jgi:hypothetical protein
MNPAPQHEEGHIAAPPSSATLLKIIGVTLATAAVALVLFILPAEYGIDPTGFGKATGLGKLSATVETAPAAAAGKSALYFTKPYRTNVIEITMPPNDELEYKVALKAGESMVYSWTSSVKNPEEFYFDFHGETPAPAGKEPVVQEYLQTTGVKSAGELTAPIDGVHGWYFQNQSAGTIKVRLEVAGFYDLVPPGQYGNDRGIEPLK